MESFRKTTSIQQVLKIFGKWNNVYENRGFYAVRAIWKCRGLSDVHRSMVTLISLLKVPDSTNSSGEDQKFSDVKDAYAFSTWSTSLYFG